VEDGQDIFERELTRNELDRLVEAGAVEESRREAVLSEFQKSIGWSRWAAQWSTILGAVFLLAGVIFFFAWNWQDLSPMVRFGVLEGGVVLATLAALFGARRLEIRQWLLVAASVLTGVLVAVYGQVYQTGADAFEVFALWAILMVGWVIVSRFAPLWLLWLAVLQTAIATWMSQVLLPASDLDQTAMFLVLGFVSAAFVVVREWLEGRDRFSWLRGEWVRVALVAATVFWFSMVVWEVVFDFHWRSSGAPVLRGIGLLVWIGVVSGGALFYTRVRPSLPSVGTCVLAAAVLVTLWFGRWILDDNFEGAGSWLVAGLVAIGVFSGAAVVIAKDAKFMTDSGVDSHSQEVAEKS